MADYYNEADQSDDCGANDCCASVPETNNCGEGSFDHERELGAGAIGEHGGKQDQDAISNSRIKELCRIFEQNEYNVNTIICGSAGTYKLDIKRFDKQGRINDLDHVSRDHGREKVRALCEIFESRVVSKKENVGDANSN